MPAHATRTRAALPAAASTLVAGLVGGRPVHATVVGGHRFALYLELGSRVLPVVTADAVPLPTAVRLAGPSGSLDWGVGHGDTVEVGLGRIVLPGTDVVSVRTWRPSRVLTPSASPAGEGSRAVGELLTAASLGCDDRLIEALTSLAPLDGRSHDGVEAVGALLGRGRGLTPSGDDALAGALLVARALGGGDALADAVRARLGATTAVSAALLDAAADGYAARAVVALVDAAVAGDADAVRRALPAVLTIGHTSGADTVAGIRCALSTVGCSDGRQGSHLSTQLEKTTKGRRAA